MKCKYMLIMKMIYFSAFQVQHSFASWEKWLHHLNDTFTYLQWSALGRQLFIWSGLFDLLTAVLRVREGSVQGQLRPSDSFCHWQWSWWKLALLPQFNPVQRFQLFNKVSWRHTLFSLKIKLCWVLQWEAKGYKDWPTFNLHLIK